MTLVTSQRTRFTELDGVRGLAILLTIACNTALVEQTSLLGKLWQKAAAGGWIGVQLFFVLSGFLITEILLESKESPHYLRNFYARRALRILPAYVVLLLIVTAIMSFSGKGLPMRAACHWLFMTNVCIAAVDHWIPYLGPIWSLAVEEHFYIFWPLVVLIVGTKRLARVALLIVALSWALRITLTLSGASGIAIYVLTPTRLDGLAAGALIAVAVRDPAIRPSLPQISRTLLATGVSTMVLVTLATLGFTFNNPYVQTAGYIGLTLASTGLVLNLVTEDDPAQTLRRLFRTPWLASVGFYSYAMYLFHVLVQNGMPMIPWLSEDIGGGRTGISFAQQIALTVSVTVASYVVALASYHLIEKHFLALRRYVGRDVGAQQTSSQRTA